MSLKTVAIVGLGGRGHHTYAKYQHLFPERMKIVAIADIDPLKVQLVKEEFNVSDDMCFTSAMDLLEQEKLADVVIIATQDGDHKEHTLKAIERGYEILLEKPISNNPLDCIEIRDAAIAKGVNITVCHVLRYTMFYKMIKQTIDSKLIGDVVAVQAIENVGYWHQAHSFVRGNWANSNETSPMILQKCCHDFDIINWLLGKKCLSLSSYGSLKHFNIKNAPEGSTERCYNCPSREKCPYDAYKIYITNENGVANGNTDWPVNIVKENPTVESITEELKTSRFGKCVYRCENNVVDHQIVNMQYEDDITVQLTMCGFTVDMSRYLKVMGTLGEIIGDQTANTVRVRTFDGQEIIYDISTLTDDLSGHGGGDNQMMTEMFDAMDTKAQTNSNIANSISSHMQAFAAEYSRVNKGLNLTIEEYEKICKNK